jgi:hypothetical protein
VILFDITIGASFQIEGERPPLNRLERWGRAVLQAGKNRLTLDEIIRLQRVLIEDLRFIQVGLRPDGVFLGERDHIGDPLPEANSRSCGTRKSPRSKP